MFFQGTQRQARLVFGLAGLAGRAGCGVGAGLRVFEGLGWADGVGAVEAGAGGRVLLAGPRDLFVGSAGHVVGAPGLGAGGLRGGLGACQLLGFLGALRVFLARDLETTETSFEREDEEATMEYAWVSLSDALDWVLAGRLHNPSTVIGILSAHAARGRGWEGLREPGAPWLR